MHYGATGSNDQRYQQLLHATWEQVRGQFGGGTGKEPTEPGVEGAVERGRILSPLPALLL